MGFGSIGGGAHSARIRCGPALPDVRPGLGAHLRQSTGASHHVVRRLWQTAVGRLADASTRGLLQSGRLQDRCGQRPEVVGAGKWLDGDPTFAHMDGRPEPITYWRLLGETVVDDATHFRLQSLSWTGASLMDGLLVRVSSIDPDLDAAWTLQASFIMDMAQVMTRSQRLRVFGAPS